MSIENYTIKRKVEKTFSEYLDELADLDDVNVYEGSDKAEEVTLPALIVYGVSQQNDDEAPYSAGLREVTLRLRYVTSSHDTDARTTLDDKIGCMEWAMQDLTAIQVAMNKLFNPDERTVKGVHIYDVLLIDASSDQEADNFIEEFEFSVKCGEHDA